MSLWITEFPTEEGLYWFYGYRYGKDGYGEDNKPELMTVKVRKIANGGCMYVANGQFMDESEVECPHFLKVTTPELPCID